MKSKKMLITLFMLITAIGLLTAQNKQLVREIEMNVTGPHFDFSLTVHPPQSGNGYVVHYESSEKISIDQSIDCLRESGSERGARFLEAVRDTRPENDWVNHWKIKPRQYEGIYRAAFEITSDPKLVIESLTAL